MTRYNKAIAAAIGLAATWAATYFPNAPWVGVLAAIASVIGVYAAPKNTTTDDDSGVTAVELLYIITLAAVASACVVWLYFKLA